MGPFVSILIVAVLILVLLLARKKSGSRNERPNKRPGPAAKAPPSTQFHAVSIKFVSSACDAARAMDGKRFLSGAAPRLPLAECDVLECKCRFVHFKDRRTGDDRRNPFGQSIAGDTGEHPEEQRAARDRRDEPPDVF